MRLRGMPIVGLVVSIPLHVVHHFTWVPSYIGYSSGLTIEVTDLWVVWLLWVYMWDLRRGQAKKIVGLAGVCAPLVLWVLAGVFSLFASTNVVLSIYGVLAQFRAAVTLVVLAVTLAQGEYEVRAARLGIVLAVAMIGGICIAETIVGTNFIDNAASVNATADAVFRAAGVSTPTLTAGYLAALLPFTCLELFDSHRIRRLLGLAALPLGLAGILCTLTRDVWGCLLIGSLPMVAYLYRRGRILRVVIPVCIVSILLGAAGMGTRMNSRLAEGNEDLIERNGLIRTALHMASSSPLVGVGINTYVLHMYEFTPKDEQQDFVYSVHNEFALCLAETGCIGLAAIGWLFFAVLRRSWELSRTRRPLAVGLLCSMLIAVLHMNFEAYVQQMLLHLFVLVAMVTALWSHHTESVIRERLSKDSRFLRYTVAVGQ